jgi:hypothetical protein
VSLCLSGDFSFVWTHWTPGWPDWANFRLLITLGNF